MHLQEKILESFVGFCYTDFCKNEGSQLIRQQNVIPTFLPKIVGIAGVFLKSRDND